MQRTRSMLVGLKKASILEAKTHFSALVRLAESGQHVSITRDGKAVAELVPSRQAKRPFGIDEGKILISKDFDAPLAPEIARGFGIE